MRNLRNFIVGFMIVTVAGCSLFSKAAPRLSNAVNKYCTTLTEDERRILRQQVNDAIKPNQACVYCNGDQANHCSLQ